MLNKKSNVVASTFRRRRATVLILVVAVLALLAVLGTVYIVAARAQRKAAASMSTSVNLNLARQAVMDMAVRAIGESALDATGQPCGYAPIGSYGTQTSRFYDYPEIGGQVAVPGSAFGKTDSNLNIKDEPWLVSKLHVFATSNYLPAPVYLSGPQFVSTTKVPYAADWPDFSRLTANFYDPSAGGYSIAASSLIRVGVNSYGIATPINTFNVVFDQTEENGTNVAKSGVPLTPKNFCTTIDGLTVDCCNPDVSNLGTSIGGSRFTDAFIQLLPFSDASGIRYRFGIRILDTSRMANLNVGATTDSLAISDTAGSYITSMRLSAATGMPAVTSYFNTAVLPNTYATADTEGNLHYVASNGLGRAGTSATYSSFSQNSWLQAVFQMERPTDKLLAFFDLTDELGLRAYGEFGTLYHIRPANINTVMWRKTLAAYPNSTSSKIVTGNAPRRNYTTYSWSRDLRPYDFQGTTKYTLTPATGTTPSNFVGFWPDFPAKISANPLTSPSPLTAPTNSDDAMFYTAMAAANIATLMRYGCGTTASSPPTTPYTPSEACSFVANYCTARWNGFQPDPAFAATTPLKAVDNTTYGDGYAYFLPAGPSFVDNQGLCFRAASVSSFPTVPTKYNREFSISDSNGNLNPGSNIYLGYAAQPYFSEIAANLLLDDTGDSTDPPTPPHTLVTDVALELYNPYPVNLSLTGFHIKSGDGATDIALDGQFIPAKGYLVILNGNSGHFVVPTPHPTAVPAYVMPAANTYRTFVPATAFTLNPGGGTFALYRTYYQRTSMTPALAPIDQIYYSVLVDPTGTDPVTGKPFLPSKKNGDSPKDFDIARVGGPWGPSVQVAFVRQDPTKDKPLPPFAMTLGDNNNNGAAGYPLPDRYAYVGPPPSSGPSSQGTPFGMGEFARIIRLSHQFDSTGNPTSLIPDQIAGLSPTTAPYTNMSTTPINLPINAQILFDFYANPSIYKTTPPNPKIPADSSSFPSFSDSSGIHDIRAVRLLEQITLVDRVSEFGINIGGASGQFDLNKLRIPGLINVNTASGDVLRAIPNMTDQMVANIIAYRRRANRTAPSYPAAGSPGTGTQAMYNSVTNSADYSSTVNFPGYGIRSLAELLVPLADSTAASIDARDKAWGSICNLCTVRSDTFVVYGFLQAVRKTPAYTAAFNNGLDWYNVAVTDDPQDSSTALQRVAERRFLAIVDRSFCNYGRDQKDSSGNTLFALPRVVAIQDLPY